MRLTIQRELTNLGYLEIEISVGSRKIQVMGRDRIFARMRPELAEALANHPVLGDDVYALPRGPDAPYAPPPRGLIAVKIPDVDRLGGLETWPHAPVELRFATVLKNEIVRRRFLWLRDAAPPAYVLGYLRALGMRYRVPIAYYHLLERGDDLYYDFAIVFDAGVERVFLHATHLGASEPGRIRFDENGLDEAPRFESVLTEVWRALGARTGPAYFPPDDSATFDWEAHRVRSLWRSARAASLARAAALVRDIREWDSDDEADRRLFGRLVGLDADELAGASTRSRVAKLPVRSSNHLHFSPDSSQIAVVPLIQEELAIEVYRVADGALMRSIPMMGQEPIWADRAIRHLGDAIVCLERSETPPPRRYRLVRHRLSEEGNREVLLDDIEAHEVTMGTIPGGFIVIAPRCLWLGASDGPVVERRIPGLGDGDPMSLLATEPRRGRVALAIDRTRELIVVDVRERALEIVGRKPLNGDDGYYAWLCGPDTLLTFGRYHRLRSWRLESGNFVEEAAMSIKDETQHGEHSLPLGVTTFCGQDAVVVARSFDTPLWYFARRLDRGIGDFTTPTGLGPRFPIWISADERYAVTGEDGLCVHETRWLELASFAERNVARLTEADFDRIEALLGRARGRE